MSLGPGPQLRCATSSPELSFFVNFHPTLFLDFNSNLHPQSHCHFPNPPSDFSEEPFTVLTAHWNPLCSCDLTFPNNFSLIILLISIYLIYLKILSNELLLTYLVRVSVERHLMSNQGNQCPNLWNKAGLFSRDQLREKKKRLCEYGNQTVLP